MCAKHRAFPRLTLAVLVVMTSAFHAAGGALKVGIFQQSQRDVAVREIVQTLEQAGMSAETFKREDLGNGNVNRFDALFFGGGWNDYDWLNERERTRLVDFVQVKGGGVIFSIFRCGCAARSSVRPAFPEIAQAYNKSNGSGITVVDKAHPITRGLPESFLTTYMDHATLRLGPKGTVLAVDNNVDVTIACGASGRGRVVFLGLWIGLDKKGKPCFPLPPLDRTLLLNSVAWAGAGKRGVADSDRLSEETRLNTLRRERLWDWTRDERGFDRKPGLLAESMMEEESALDDYIYRASKLRPYATGETARRLSDLEDKLSQLQKQLLAAYDEAKQRKAAEISRMSASELEQKPAWKGTLLPTQETRSCADELEALENALAPTVAREKAIAAEKERAEDSRRVPDLIDQLNFGSQNQRAEAALELGRIGDRRSIPALIKALDDKDRVVVRNAIYALSWARAAEAEGKLLALGGTTKDITIKRRVVQALGMIGEREAEDFLIGRLDDGDSHVRQNAILSLGWLKSRKALPRLLQMATDKGASREELGCLIVALGHIGDKSANATLADLAKSRQEPTLCPYKNTMPARLLRESAAREIAAGGRPSLGIVQPDFLREKRNFHWLTGKYNVALGRFFKYGAPTHEQRVRIIRQLERVGVTALQGENDLVGQCLVKKTPVVEQASLDDYLAGKAATEDYFPLLAEVGVKYMPYWFRNSSSINVKADYEYDLLRIGGSPCLGGYWAEEDLSWAHGFREGKGFHEPKAFQKYLADKYAPEALSAFGIDDIQAVPIPAMDDTGRQDKFLFAEYMEFVADRGVDEYQETAEWIKQFRMGTEFLYNLGGRGRAGSGKSTYISGYPRVSAALSSSGPQSYSEHSSGNVFDLEAHLDGETRPVHGQFYSHQTDCAARVERGYAASLPHGQFFFQFAWYSIQKRPWVWLNGWEKECAEAARRQFQKGKALSEYLVNADSPKRVALLFSGRTSALTFGQDTPDSHFFGRICHRYTQNQQALWEAVMQSHLPVDILWLETLSLAKLARYQVAILSDARSLSEKEEDCLRNWVKAGGALIATASATLHDQWDKPRKNYGLADVFGVDYLKTEPPRQEAFRLYVDRDIKPSAGIAKIKFADAGYQKLMTGKAFAEYELSLGRDLFKPTHARPIATWDDGEPAIVENLYGKGLCVFLGAAHPGLSHKTIGWTVEPLRLEFWDGARELIDACVERGLKFTNAKPPLEVKNCPSYVEAIVRTQNKRKREMIHLLNYEYHPDARLVKGVEVKLDIAGKNVSEVYYPYPGKKTATYSIENNTLNIKTRDFDIHDMIVVEWK